MRPPRLPSVFKLTDHNRYKSFNYEPRTFNERKENLAKRKKSIEKELELEQKLGKNYEEHLRERISESWSRKETRRVQRNSGLRLLLILTALIAVVYYFLA